MKNSKILQVQARYYAVVCDVKDFLDILIEPVSEFPRIRSSPHSPFVHISDRRSFFPCKRSRGKLVENQWVNFL